MKVQNAFGASCLCLSLRGLLLAIEHGPFESSHTVCLSFIKIKADLSAMMDHLPLGSRGPQRGPMAKSPTHLALLLELH